MPRFLITLQASLPKKAKIEIKRFTQAELIAQALDTEEGNIVEHRDYLTSRTNCHYRSFVTVDKQKRGNQSGHHPSTTTSCSCLSSSRSSPTSRYARGRFTLSKYLRTAWWFVHSYNIQLCWRSRHRFDKSVHVGFRFSGHYNTSYDISAHGDAILIVLSLYGPHPFCIPYMATTAAAICPTNYSSRDGAYLA